MLEIKTMMAQSAAKGALQSDTQRSKAAKATQQQVANLPGGDAVMAGAAAQRLDPLEKIERTLTELLDSYMGDNARLSIEQHESGRYVYRSVDVESGEVIYQWPAEDFLRTLEHVIVDDPGLSQMVGMALNEIA